MKVQGTVRLELPCSPPFVGVARKAIEGIAFTLRLPEEVANDLRLAVGEACTNAVKYADSKCDPITVTYIVSPDNIEIEVRNRGDGFRGTVRHIKPEISKLPVGGLGLYVIEEVMDKVEITSEDGETILRMSKHLGE